MNYEEEVAALMRADPPLMAILTGGVYTDGQLGVEGLRREEGMDSFAAFNDDGVLLPCSVIHQRGKIPTGDIYDHEAINVSMRQAVEIYFYQFRGHDKIDSAALRTFFVLFGKRLTKTYPIECQGESGYFYDVGPVENATTQRQEWLVTFIRKP